MHPMSPLSHHRARLSSPSHPTIARWTRRGLPLAAFALCALVALALAGCGVNHTSVARASNDSQAHGPATGGSVHGTTIRPCTGTSVAASKAPTIVLTTSNSHETTQAHIGDVIEVQLSAKFHWSPPTDKTPGVLKPLQPQGGQDEQTQTCRWLYDVVAGGTTTLAFHGAPLCESNAPCPAYALAEEFIIHVS